MGERVMINWRFIFKNLKSNMRNNAFLIVGIIFNLSFVYCFLFLEAAAESSDSLRIAWNYGSMVGTVGTCAKISMLSGFFLTMSIAFPYIKGRIREYSLLLVLGIEKKEMYLLLGMEYVILWGLTLFASLFSGTALSVAVYAVLNLSGYPVGEVNWLASGCGACGKIILLSVGYMACTFAYLLVRMNNQDLSELAAEAGKPEKMKNMRKAVRMGAIGIALVILSLILQFPTRYWPRFLKGGEDDRLVVAFVAFVIGMYLLIASGMSAVLAFFMRRKRYYYKNALSIRSVRFRVSTYKNTIFAVLLINFAVLFFVGDSVAIFPGEENDYSWRYPYDFIGSMTEEDAGKWEKVCREDGDEKGLVCVPYVDMQSETGAEFIGISESAYEEMTSKNVRLEKNQILLCAQMNEADGWKALESWEGEEDIVFEFGEEIKEYTIKAKEVDILTIGGLVLDSLVYAAVFEDGEYQEILSKLKASELLVRQEFEEGKQPRMEQKAQDFKRKNPQVSCITKVEALNIETLVDRISNVIYVFCMACLAIAGLSMLSVKLFSEIPALEKKYMFLSDVGMEHEEIKKETGKEIRHLIFIPAVLGIFMAAVYKANILWRYIQMNPGEHFYAEDELPAFLWEMSRDWLCVTVVFCLVQLLYGKYVVSFIRRRVNLAVAKKE